MNATYDTETGLILEKARPLPPRTSFLGVWIDSFTYKSIFYAMLLLPMSILWFVYGITFFSLSVGLAITIFGLPVAYVFLLSLPRLLAIQGALAEEMTGVSIPRVVNPQLSGNFFERFGQLVQNTSTWTAFLYSLLILPVGILVYVLTVTSLSVSFSLMLAILYPVVRSILINVGVEFEDYQYVNYFTPWLPEWVVLVVVSVGGFILLTLALHAVRGMARFDAQILSAIIKS